MPDQYRRRFEEDRRDDRRDFQDRAGDEIRSWFGDDEARARRGNDERHDRYPYGGERDRSWQNQGDGGYRNEQRPWSSEVRGGGSDRSQRENSQYGQSNQYGQGGRSGQSGQYGQGGQYGSSTYDRGSYSRGSERDWQRPGDERSWNRGGGQGDSQTGSSDRWGTGSDDSWRGAQGRGAEESGRSSFGGYGNGGYGNGGYGAGRQESGRHSEGGTFSGSERGRESFWGRGPKDYKRSDERIREEISDRLTDDHHVDATEISIQVQGGEVTLTGTVPNRDQKRRAEDLAESISGVREVTNSLRVNRQDQAAHGLQNPLGLAASATADTAGGGQSQPQSPSQANTSSLAKGNRSTTSG